MDSDQTTFSKQKNLVIKKKKMTGKRNTPFQNLPMKRGGNFPVFSGHYYPHTGYGIRAILSGLFRTDIPLIKLLVKKVAKTAGKELFKGGTNIISDILKGKNVKSIIKRRGLQAVSNLAEKALHNRLDTSIHTGKNERLVLRIGNVLNVGRNLIPLIYSNHSMTNLLDRESCECINSSLDLFTTPTTQLSCEKSRYIEYYPQTSVDLEAPLEFILYSSTEYIDPSSVIQYIKSNILAANGNRLPEVTSGTNATIPNKSFCWPINYIYGTRFKTVKVYVCGHRISESDFL